MKQRQKSKKILQSLKNLITETPIESSISDLDRRAELLLRKLERKELSDKEFNSLDKDLKELFIKKIMEINEDKLKQNPKGNEKANKKLLKSAEKGSIVGILYSLLKGADINTKDKEYLTILHKATLEDHLNIFQLFAENKYLGDKIDWNTKNNDGWTFLYMAASYGYLDIIKFLAKDKYLRDKIDWNAKDYAGDTFFHNVAYKGRLNIIKFLAKDKYLRDKIDWNTKNNDGWTILHKAVSRDHLNIIKFFFENKENFRLIKNSVYALNKEGYTILGIAGGEVETYLVNMRYNPFIGKVNRLEDYKEYYKELLGKIKTIEDAKKIAKENNFYEDVFIIGISLYFAENCDNRLLTFVY